MCQVKSALNFATRAFSSNEVVLAVLFRAGGVPSVSIGLSRGSAQVEAAPTLATAASASGLSPQISEPPPPAAAALPRSSTQRQSGAEAAPQAAGEVTFCLSVFHNLSYRP